MKSGAKKMNRLAELRSTEDEQAIKDEQGARDVQQTVEKFQRM